MVLNRNSMTQLIPRHVAIIMDGNGRWAEQRGWERFAGHRAGVDAVRRTTEEAVRLGIEQLTLYAFSTENWRRPTREVNFLMKLFSRFLRAERENLRANGVRLTTIGRTDELPVFVQEELEHAIEFTAKEKALTLCMAINYGARRELVDACRMLVRLGRDRLITPEKVDELAIKACLYQPDMPPLDLMIRTGGEMRLSNFLLWQAAYAEIWVTPVCWPDFAPKHLHDAIAVFQKRERRFGGVPTRQPVRIRA